MSKILRIFIILVIGAVALAGAACSKAENPSIDLAAAVTSVSASATELTVRSYDNNREETIQKGSPGFDTVMTYLTDYSPDRTQPRYQEVGGKQEEVTIPYVLNFVLTFKLSDGSTLVFDYGYDKVWFTTESMLYAGLVELDMDGVLKQIVGQ